LLAKYLSVGFGRRHGVVVLTGMFGSLRLQCLMEDESPNWWITPLTAACLLVAAILIAFSVGRRPRLEPHHRQVSL
jgi:hypothetical protein